MTVSDRQRMRFDEDLESKYEILDELGGGGMGRVLRARHRQLRRPVAIKLLQHDLRASEAVGRFLREARAAAQIRSIHVAHVMDAGILRNGQPYIVMEYLHGQDLARLIAAQGRLSVEQAVGFTLQALDALAEAHALQIIHRDIKPGNLFATRLAGGETSIKVVDFGLAKTSPALDTIDPSLTERGAVLGTPSYMSPEQFVDAQDVDARADIWGIGATLFELLTGVPPFTGTNLPQIYTAVMHNPIPWVRSSVPELPEGLERVVAKCLMRERDQRYADVGQLAIALEPWAGDAARQQVERIHRVLAGATTADSTLGWDTDAAALDLLFDSNERSTPVSSTFARAARDLGSPSTSIARAPARRPTRKILAAALILGLVVGGAILGWSRRNEPGSARTPPASVAPAASRSAGVDPSTVIGEPSLKRDSTLATQLPAAESIAPPPSESVPIAAPPSPIVSRPTANKPRRSKNIAKTPAVQIYEQYP